MKRGNEVISDERWMALALAEARKAEAKGEVPIGAVLVYQNRLVARGHNQSILRNDPTAHAEILCLRAAARKLKNYRLTGAVLYVTLEPCAMCAGAMVWARVGKTVYGCRDKKAGALGTVLDLSQMKNFNHRFEASRGVLEPECRSILQAFFASKRKRK